MNEMSSQYPKVKIDYFHVDAMCIFLIEAPERFDVIVTTNMFGDIITDLAAVTQGGMGVAPSGNINPAGVSMFEPVHGSAPQFTGKGVANPLAAILTVKLMLEHLKEEKAAQAIDAAVQSGDVKNEIYADRSNGIFNRSNRGYGVVDIAFDVIPNEMLIERILKTGNP